jgi:hypothetical protein
MVDQGTSAASAPRENRAADATRVTPTPHTLNRTASERQTIAAAALAAWAQAPTGTSAAESVQVEAGISAAESANALSAADSLGSSGGGDGSDEQARRDYEDFRAAMAEIRGGLQQLLETEHRPGQREQIARLLARADVQTVDADEVLQAGPGQPPDGSFRLVTGHSTLVDDAGDAETAAQDKDKSLWQQIRDWLKKAGRKLWDMISRLLKVKEWSITGTAGTGLLGLAQASISVTFC